jgi:hypothetical protein
MRFQLKQVSTGNLLNKFHILDASGDTVESANIPTAEVKNFSGELDRDRWETRPNAISR